MAGRLVFILMALGFTVGAIRLSVFKTFSLDEFQYAHAAWLLARGAIPYRDFFEVHLPLVYQWLAPVFLVAGDEPGAVVALRVGMLPFLLLTLLSAARLNAREGRVATWLAPVLLLCCPAYLTFAVEIRPDPAAFALFVAALAALASPRLEPRTRGLVAGALLVLAVWGSQKVLFYGAIFAAALLLDALRRREPALLAHPRSFLLGVGVALVPIAAYLTLTGSWEAWWRWCFVWAAAHQRGYPGFSWQRYLVPMLHQQPWFFGLSLVGFLHTVRRWWAQGSRRLADVDLLVMAAVPMTLGSFVLQQAPYPYSLIA